MAQIKVEPICRGDVIISFVTYEYEFLLVAIPVEYVEAVLRHYDYHVLDQFDFYGREGN